MVVHFSCSVIPYLHSICQILLHETMYTSGISKGFDEKTRPELHCPKKGILLN